MSVDTYYDLKAPIRTLVLRENYNFALIFPIDVRKEMKFELYFFRVARVYPIERVYVLPEMAPGEKRDFTYFGEAGPGAGDDIFAMSEERPYRILHFSYGVAPPDVKVWRQQPSGFTSTGWSRKVPTAVGDPVDYIDGRLSPFEEPTRASETVMWYKGSVTFGVKNDCPVSVVPKLRFLGAGYDCWLISDRAVVERAVRGAIPCRFISVGGLAEVRYTVPDEWRGKGYVAGLEEVTKLMRGEGRG